MASEIEQVPYFPDRNGYESRIFDHSRNSSIETDLPPGFPKSLVSKMAWEREDISLDEAPASGTPYVLILQGPQLVEIDAALRHFQNLAQPMDTLDPSTFPLPCLHSVLRSVSHNLHSGYGFTLIRGVPVERYTRAENIIIYVGISSHIAAIRGRQDHQFEGQPADVMLAHITDMRRPGDVQNYALAAYSDSEVVFHTDVGDIVSLFVLGEPVSGGESLLASGWTVYNALAETRPDLIHVLAEDWPIPSAQEPGVFKYRPLLYYQPSCGSAPERVILQFSRRSFSGFGAHSQPSMLSPTQVEALDALHFLAEKHHVAMELKKGDMQFINNLSMIHARNSYVDDPENRRHLLRLWLRDPQNAWVTPEPLRSRADRIYSENHRRGPQIFPVDPIPRSVGKARKD
ncbi:hypothetical protein BDV37DRAFT_295394 [Aspergillus pseudonomiae]|uniref:TauD/TfdA-like domain-containing protein n=1 Tax=Aspergillus pseudonomiae TaxID=1506151 RepID=A0A5N7D8U6_9EURO|nr:uncharacterized protein BDV37DRAFT_295394 [Aspergillus pseudonomiae]KAE8402393.1 hypothetical protein BDV37DRAFT_295394 [Aspergillus pseudonomiae]